METTYYVCKYTPIELLKAYGGECQNLNHMKAGFDAADSVSHPNLCGFGKTIFEEVLAGQVRELVLVNCCDTIKSVYDLLKARGDLDFIYMLDVLHADSGCGRQLLAQQLKKLAEAYGEYKGTTFDAKRFRESFQRPRRSPQDHLMVLGARMGDELFEEVQKSMPIPVINGTCVNNRNVGCEVMPETEDFSELMDWYAGELLSQVACMRMSNVVSRRQILNDPGLVGIIYHTVKFCDFYGFEYAKLKDESPLPLLKIESDYTTQSQGQLSTRLEAFSEQVFGKKVRAEIPVERGFYAGVDSGSTSTDVVILNEKKEIVTSVILPTGAGAAMGAERALEEALKKAGLQREQIRAMVTTGYGRDAIAIGDKSITEISCHAKGAHYLEPGVRTIIDIGGQDSKVIRVDEKGSVLNFVMNDKCAAGTGRFMEMMARSLEMSLEEMAGRGLDYREDITISSMCTVFAESEVVGLIARNKSRDDIIHGLDKAVAAKTGSLVDRVKGMEPYMMTGGVARNAGLVKALEERIGAHLIISESAQLAGAIGAALYAMEM